MTDRADRLRIASLLLAPRDREGVVRTPLQPDEARAVIRAMPNMERASLTLLVDWVESYEANETPERRAGDPTGRNAA